MNRAEILDAAKVCVCGQRETDYGTPEDNFETIGHLWGTYLRAAHPRLKMVFAANEVTAKDVAAMCYIQLSLLGCAGYVVVGNTLTSPSLSADPRGLMPVHGSNVWYTPMYFRQEWHMRRVWTMMDRLFEPKKEEPEK